MTFSCSESWWTYSKLYKLHPFRKLSIYGFNPIMPGDHKKVKYTLKLFQYSKQNFQCVLVDENAGT